MKNIFIIVKAELYYSRFPVILSLAVFLIWSVLDVINIYGFAGSVFSNLDVPISFGLLFSWVQLYSKEKHFLIYCIAPATRLQVILARLLVVILWMGSALVINLLLGKLAGINNDHDRTMLMFSYLFYFIFFGGFNVFNDFPHLFNDSRPLYRLILYFALLFLVSIVFVAVIILGISFFKDNIVLIFSILGLLANLASIYTFTRRKNYIAG